MDKEKLRREARHGGRETEEAEEEEYFDGGMVASDDGGEKKLPVARDDDDVEEREEEAAIAIGACEASVLVCVDKPFSAESLLKPLGRTLRDICPVSH